MAGTAFVSASGNQDIDGQLSSVKWNTQNLTFSFPTSGSYYGYSGEADSGFEVLNATQQTTVRNILTHYSSVANVSFTELTETSSTHADLRFAESNLPSTAWAYYPSSGEWGGDSWYNHTSYDAPLKGTYAYSTFVHEIGHAMGLKHGHETSTYGPLPTDHDTAEYSIMTYRSYVGSPGNFYTISSGDGPQTLMLSDIAALQYMYGANFSHNSGDSTYSWDVNSGELSINGAGQGASTANTVFLTVWDGGGTDTYDFSNYSTNLIVNLGPGEWTTLSTTQLAHLGSGNFARGNIANAWLYEGNKIGRAHV